MKRVVLTDHARFEMERRGIPEDTVYRVAAAPEQVVPAPRGRMIYQSRLSRSQGGRPLLVRAVVEERGDTLTVVTVYASSKIAKYWQPEAER